MKPIKHLLLLLPLAIFWLFNHQNMPLQFSLLLGIIACPYVVQTNPEKGGFRYAILATIVGGFLLFFRSSSLYYFSSIFIVFFILEKYWGQLNILPFLLAIVVSPVLSSIVYIWSFPIRLQLSEWAGQVLQTIGMNIQVNGNVLLLDGHTFSVDPACMGLKMLITSLILGIIILAHFEKKRQRELKLWEAILYLGSILLAAILANFIRLLTLILFHILPENPMHDVVGLLSLACYVLVPFYFLVKWTFKKRETAPTLPFSQKESQPKILHQVIIIALLILQIQNGRQFLNEPIENFQAIENIELPNFEKEITPNGVLKLQNDKALIYIKPPVRFFQGSHDPRFCWQGSGYTFSEVRIQQIGTKEVYTAILQKEDDQLYTAWWYENQIKQTPHEWNWRWQTFKGEGDYYMMNVSCTDLEELYILCRKGLLF